MTDLLKRDRAMREVYEVYLRYERTKSLEECAVVTIIYMMMRKIVNNYMFSDMSLRSLKDLLKEKDCPKEIAISVEKFLESLDWEDSRV